MGTIESQGARTDAQHQPDIHDENVLLPDAPEGDWEIVIEDEGYMCVMRPPGSFGPEEG